MKPEVDYALAFMTGILGSFHCIGMCGGIVSAVFTKMGNRAGFSHYVYYHLGRILTYVIIGAAAALLGMTLAKTGLFGKVQGILHIVAGIAVIIIGLDILGVLPWKLSYGSLPGDSMKNIFGSIKKIGNSAGYVLAGMFNGLIPCSLVFAIGIKAASTGEPLQGGLLMLFFGAGTVPAMLFVSLAFGKIGAKARGAFIKAAAVVIVVMGCYTLYKGYFFFNIMKGLAN